MAIAELAERQQGVVARRQLLGLGLSGSAIDHRCERGRLHFVHRGVYSVGHRLVSREGRWMAAVLACGPDAMLSHRSAAALWGIQKTPGGSIDVTVPRKSNSSTGIRRHCARLPADEVTTRDGIPVTIVPRTIFDLAAVSSVDVVESALRESEYLRLYDRLSLQDLLARYSGRRGVKAVRECLRRRVDLPAGRTRSPLEERFLPFWRDTACLALVSMPGFRLAGAHFRSTACSWSRESSSSSTASLPMHPARLRERPRSRPTPPSREHRSARITWRQLDDEPEQIAADLRRLIAAGVGASAARA
jgi:hypothetical protein